MITRTLPDGKQVPALGLGCWAIGGPFFSGATPLGWGDVDDATSRDAIACAIDHGVRVFDTAQAYGAGHSEVVLGDALARHKDVFVTTKVGYAFDAASKQITGEVTSPAKIIASVEQSLRRLKRDRLDLVLLHLNELPIAEAEAVFAVLGDLRQAGKVGHFGWSTDYPDRAAAFSHVPGFAAVEHALNVFFRADRLLPVLEDKQLLSINRSPLAMGVLGGKYDGKSVFVTGDVRSNTMDWMAYFKGGRISPDYLQRLDAVRELLTQGGRTVPQGALCWIWGRSATTLPVPGFRTRAQVEEIVGSLRFGPLPAATMVEIENILKRLPEGEPRAR